MKTEKIDYKLFYSNIETHVRIMATDEMKEHAGIKPGYDLAFQVYRYLLGYDEALTELHVK